MGQKIVLYSGRNVVVKFGDEAKSEDFAAQFSSVILKMSVETITSKGMKTGAIYQDVDDPSFSLALEGFQARVSGLPEPGQDGLQAFIDYAWLWHGHKLPFTFLPDESDPTKGFTGTLTMMGTDNGGGRGSHHTFSIDLPVDGTPTRLDGKLLGGGKD